MDWIDRLLRFFDAIGPFLIVGGAITLVAWVVYASIQEQGEWDAFAKAHHCQVLETKKGKTHTVVVDGKIGFVTDPDETTYLCDDGKRYTR